MRSRSTCAGWSPPRAATWTPRPTALRAALRGDCHTHSDWSDGGSPIEEMALAAVELGHEYLVLTDHSPRLTVARGLTADRLRRQLDHVAQVNAALPEGFRILTGIEVDILADGSLDQDDELLARLDVVVGSVHSGLQGRAGEDDPPDADRGRQPAPGHPRPLHRPDGVVPPGRGDRPGRQGAPGRGPGRRATSTRTRSSPPAPSTTWPSRSTPGRSGRTRRSG